jgi:hypothetical protein
MSLEDSVIFIEKAEHVGDYRLRLHFNDGTMRVIDFGPFLRQSGNPYIRVYLEPDRFLQFTVKQGDLMWGDYDLCFPVADLYEGRL